MTQYAISTLTGRVLGFLESDTMPVLNDDGRIAHVMIEPIAAWPDAPTPTSELWINNGALNWVEKADIERLRAARNQTINAWKVEANNSYFMFGGKQIAYRDVDRVEIQAINNVVMLTGAMPTHPDWPKAWKAMDNTWVPLPDKDTWIAFNLAIAERGTAHFKRAQELKGELARATTPAEIEAITW